MVILGLGVMAILIIAWARASSKGINRAADGIAAAARRIDEGPKAGSFGEAYARARNRFK